MINQSDAALILSNEYGVSSGTLFKLIEYQKLVKKWQPSVGLVIQGTLKNIWEKHILCSAKFINYLPNSSCRILDVGSGGGFPGLVISIMTDHEVLLVDSDKKKCLFLHTVIKKLNLTAKVYNYSIEDLPCVYADYITARRFSELLKLTKKQLHGSVKFLSMSKWATVTEKEIRWTQ